MIILKENKNGEDAYTDTTYTDTNLTASGTFLKKLPEEIITQIKNEFPGFNVTCFPYNVDAGEGQIYVQGQAKITYRYVTEWEAGDDWYPGYCYSYIWEIKENTIPESYNITLDEFKKKLSEIVKGYFEVDKVYYTDGDWELIKAEDFEDIEDIDISSETYKGMIELEIYKRFDEEQENY